MKKKENLAKKKNKKKNFFWEKIWKTTVMFKPQVAISVSYIRYAPFVQVTCETEVIPKFKNETKNE